VALDDSPGHSDRRDFWVLERNLPELARRIAALARRAQRLGTGPIAVRATGERRGELARVVLAGEPPALAGWILIATVDHRGPAPRLRFVSPRASALDPRRFAESHCDHCGLRRRRTTTYVLWHAATARVHQVGSRCLPDLLDGHDPQRLCRQAEYVTLAEQTLRNAAASSTGSAPTEIALEQFATHAAHVLRADGWISLRRARETGRTATADAALLSLQRDPQAPDAGDQALARGPLRWARELLAARPELSPFERDAVATARRATIATGRDRGLLCALIAAYRSRRARSQHLGEVGAWLETVLLVEHVRSQPSQRHGIARRHDLLDVHGNRVVWWQTSGPPLPLEQAIHLRGRVERHTRFGTTAVTVLSRCRALDRALR
jgi:hypothetical protein